MKTEDIISGLQLVALFGAGYLTYKVGSALIKKAKEGADWVSDIPKEIKRVVSEETAAAGRAVKKGVKSFAGEYTETSAPAEDQSQAETNRLNGQAKFLRQVEEWSNQKQLNIPESQGYFNTTGAGSAG